MSLLRHHLNLSYIPRWAIVPMLREQTVADHSWRVAMIAVILAERIGMDTEQVAFIAIGHDLDEATTGDIPATQKEAPNFEDMITEDLIVKVADYLEQVSWVEMWAHPSAKDRVRAEVWLRLNPAVETLDARREGAGAAVAAVLSELGG